MGDARRDAVVGALVGFGQALRTLGVEPGVSRIETAAGALGMVDPRDREAVYWALRCSLISGLEQVDAFDTVFDAFWAGDRLPPGSPPGAPTPQPGAPDSEPGSFGSAHALEPAAPGAGETEDAGSPRAGGWSATERLREMDFGAYGPDELAAARQLVRRIAQAVPRRRSRRLRTTARGTQLDRRATLRAAMRSEGHPLRLVWRSQTQVPRKLVFLVDVSGSMEPYARVVLMFLQAVRQASRNVEVFAFGTRLTRLTRELAGRDPEHALDRVAEAVPDWAGGTRVGEALEAFDRRWGRRGMTRGAAMVIFSDGWERGDLALLREQMTRLQRAAHTLIWVNPLAGSPQYRPLAAGMATALPFVDVFLAGHNLNSLEGLAGALADLPERRVRRGLGKGPNVLFGRAG